MSTTGTLIKGMASLRFFSGAVEVAAALAMLRTARLETAVGINAILGLFGPILFAVVSALGLWGLAGRLAPSRFLLVLAGVSLVLLGSVRSGA